MSFIHENANWPQFGWNSDVLSPVLAALRYREGQLIGRMQSLGFAFRQEASLKTLTDDVVKSSAIEGENLNPEEVRSSIARRLGLDIGGLVESSRNVDGIVEMMLDATQRFAEPLTRERLFGWHAALFPTGRSGMQRITVGDWRPEEAGAMQVISGPYGREKVHFEAPTADRLQSEMARFLEWFNAPFSTDPVLRAGIAHFWFVTIHPFEDGNGRIARAIADMSLARADGSKDRFYSMSAQIEAERRDYYDRLETQQRNGLDITPWLNWFLDCLGRALDRAEAILEAVLYKAKLWDKVNHHPVNQRQRLVIDRMLEDGWEGHLNTSKYAKLAKCSTDTALRDIRDLLQAGVLFQNVGGGRSTSYRLAGAGDL
ncbi:Fic family protein [Pelagerythrobacter aerophilus]|uniref:Fic family protein n=1 Tax=Pelagerythrobacter aerophilus TaxID=2306995 RepID=A0A418NH11_9SPHN|nr:Fic family protein [Pelagerythrobacter aerophilus]RIV77522.1 Fic family protein [Pelagerythrobacter aerophilus]